MKASASNYLNRIGEVTAADARAYRDTDEKFTFCADLLEISAQDDRCDVLVEILEAYFEDMIEEGV
jgi:hypothetical protein